MLWLNSQQRKGEGAPHKNEQKHIKRILNMAQILDVFITDIEIVFKYKFSSCLKMLKQGLLFVYLHLWI